MTQVVSLGDIYCKVSMLICLRSSSSLTRLGLGRWGETRVPGEGEETGDSLKGFGGPSEHHESHSCLSISVSYRMQTSSALF